MIDGSYRDIAAGGLVLPSHKATLTTVPNTVVLKNETRPILASRISSMAIAALVLASLRDRKGQLTQTSLPALVDTSAGGMALARSGYVRKYRSHDLQRVSWQCLLTGGGRTCPNGRFRAQSCRHRASGRTRPIDSGRTLADRAATCCHAVSFITSIPTAMFGWKIRLRSSSSVGAEPPASFASASSARRIPCILSSFL